MTFDVRKKIDEGLLKLFIKDLQPFKIADDEEFKNFVKFLNPSYKISDCHTISKVQIPALYQKCVNETKELIRNESLNGCLTTDCWTSRNNIAFISITFHFIDTNFVLRSVLLGCYEFSESHTGLNLSNTIQETLDKWNMDKNKIILVVSDNANNIKSALNLLQVKSLGCFARTLNLIVQNALKLQLCLIEKIKCIVTHFRKSSRANHKLNVYQTSNGSKVPKKLLQDISTRWNSTYYMLDRFLELEDAIRGTLGLLDNNPIGLTIDEWTIVKELIQVLRPFEEATKAVSSSKYMTGSIIIVISQGLKNVCEQMIKNNFRVEVINVLQELLNGMKHKDRCGTIENSKMLVRCTFLDRRFKAITLSSSM
ncbi:zinc finger BED domain-containing protein 4-like [Aphis craccivora]|uniref:Zinc finger BED domain-containing protein 4-like n=1 Tax=Aphis craccivora TaxID=307492 RepID=A0A6G0YFL3_APHCR|nr:zinc finger BED domain-containing protein 4-like [Aphis craccivora]